MSYDYAYINLNGSAGSAASLMQQLIDATNLKAAGLAVCMGVAPSTITRILHGQVCPGYDDMVHYAHCLGFQIENNNIIKPEHLRGYRSPKEIGDILNKELDAGLNSERLRFILRYLPKTVIDWQDLPKTDVQKLMLQPSKVSDIRFQALVEGVVQFFVHNWYWQDAPKWTYKTSLKKQFIPRAAVRELGKQRYNRLQMKIAPEFISKNIVFTYDEMQVF